MSSTQAEREYHRARHQAYRDAGLCTICGAERDEEGRKTCRKCRGVTARWQAKNPEMWARKESAYTARLLKAKWQVYEHYGNRCACCGEDNPAFFTIDHINNDGAQQRAERRPGKDMYVQIVKRGFPGDLRILCYNCNCGRYARGIDGQCPHELNIDGWHRSRVSFRFHGQSAAASQPG